MPPAPSCWAHGNIATPAGAGENSKAQLVTCQALGLTVPMSIAVVAVIALGAPVTAAGADGVQVNTTDGCAPSVLGTSEKPETPAAPAGIPEAPPPPPPPPPLLTAKDGLIVPWAPPPPPPPKIPPPPPPPPPPMPRPPAPPKPSCPADGQPVPSTGSQAEEGLPAVPPADALPR